MGSHWSPKTACGTSLFKTRLIVEHFVGHFYVIFMLSRLQKVVYEIIFSLMSVLYRFEWEVLCISTRFWVLRSPKSWSNYFFQPFATFFWNCFCWFQVWNHWERFKMNKKGWKLLKKSSLTSLWVRAAPKSWLKNTTELDYYLNGKIVSSHQLSCHSIFTSKESGTIPSTSFKSEQNGAIGTRLEVKRKYLIFCKQWLASAF